MAEIDEAPSAPTPAEGLRLRDVGVRLGSQDILRQVSLMVPTGHITGLVGTNGAGKTTTMRAILGVIAHTDGSITWQGRDIDHHTTTSFGYMPEERGLYPCMTVGDQLVYHARLHGLTRAAARNAADEWGERVGLGEVMHRSVESLSLGNQQRVQVAVALAHKPRVLVLDEPFSGLDPAGVDQLSNVLRERARLGVSVLLSSHQLQLVQSLCDSVTVISKGTVVADATVHELRTAAGRVLRVETSSGLGSRRTAVALRAMGFGAAKVLPGGNHELTMTVTSGRQALAVLRRLDPLLDIQDFRIEAASLHDALRGVLRQ